MIDECKTEIIRDAFLKVLTGTVKLAIGLATGEEEEEVLSYVYASGESPVSKAINAGFNSIADLQKSSKDLLEQFEGEGLSWDPSKEMPVLPESTQDGFFANEQYAAASYQWYFTGQESLADSLVVWSPAKWDDIYIENEKQYGPSKSRLDIFVKMLLLLTNLSPLLLLYAH